MNNILSDGSTDKIVRFEGLPAGSPTYVTLTRVPPNSGPMKGLGKARIHAEYIRREDGAFPKSASVIDFSSAEKIQESMQAHPDVATLLFLSLPALGDIAGSTSAPKSSPGAQVVEDTAGLKAELEKANQKLAECETDSREIRGSVKVFLEKMLVGKRIDVAFSAEDGLTGQAQPERVTIKSITLTDDVKTVPHPSTMGFAAGSVPAGKDARLYKIVVESENGEETYQYTAEEIVDGVNEATRQEEVEATLLLVKVGKQDLNIRQLKSESERKTQRIAQLQAQLAAAPAAPSPDRALKNFEAARKKAIQPVKRAFNAAFGAGKNQLNQTNRAASAMYVYKTEGKFNRKMTQVATSRNPQKAYEQKMKWLMEKKKFADAVMAKVVLFNKALAEYENTYDPRTDNDNEYFATQDLSKTMNYKDG